MAVEVVSPALHRAGGGQRARVKLARADRGHAAAEACDVDWRWSIQGAAVAELAVGVISPALHRAGGGQRAGVILARAGLADRFVEHAGCLCGSGAGYSGQSEQRQSRQRGADVAPEAGGQLFASVAANEGNERYDESRWRRAWLAVDHVVPGNALSDTMPSFAYYVMLHRTI